MDLFSSLCRQWANQYLELMHQQQQITETLLTLKGLIMSNGGKLPEFDGRPKADIVAAEVPVSASVVPKSQPLANFDSKGSWAYKIEYVLAAGRNPDSDPLPVADIAAALMQMEPELNLDKVIKAVTMEASKLGLNGRLGIRKKGNKNFYFLPRQVSLQLDLKD